MLYNKKVKFIVASFIIFFFTISIAFGQGFKKNRFDLKVSVASVYDDNVLKYIILNFSRKRRLNFLHRLITTRMLIIL